MLTLTRTINNQEGMSEEADVESFFRHWALRYCQDKVTLAKSIDAVVQSTRMAKKDWQHSEAWPNIAIFIYPFKGDPSTLSSLAMHIIDFSSELSCSFPIPEGTPWLKNLTTENLHSFFNHDKKEEIYFWLSNIKTHFCSLNFLNPFEGIKKLARIPFLMDIWEEDPEQFLEQYMKHQHPFDWIKSVLFALEHDMMNNGNTDLGSAQKKCLCLFDLVWSQHSAITHHESQWQKFFSVFNYYIAFIKQDEDRKQELFTNTDFLYAYGKDTEAKKRFFSTCATMIIDEYLESINLINTDTADPNSWGEQGFIDLVVQILKKIPDLDEQHLRIHNEKLASFLKKLLKLQEKSKISAKNLAQLEDLMGDAAKHLNENQAEKKSSSQLDTLHLHAAKKPRQDVGNEPFSQPTLPF